MRHPKAWRFWIDRGGTFTDVVCRTPAGEIETLKLLSENPSRYADAAIEGIRRFLSAAEPQHRLVAEVRMGTTVATNALLERRGERTALVITAGLKDAIRIGGQSRPDIFALDIRLPEMLYERVIEAEERIGAHGEVVLPLDEARLRADLEDARSAGVGAVAVVLLHAYRYPRHERRVRAIASAAGFDQISLSHEVSPLMRLVPRGSTTLVDAYLSPVLRRYVGGLRRGIDRQLAATPLLFMQSHGGLVDADLFRGKNSILSGPAGGVIGMAAAAREAGFERVLGFDMGGTSTDVSLFDGEFERTTSAEIGGVRVTTPMMRIHTVAAGGGSILKFAGARLQVGPESAGARPGPACYRNGGPPTVTDANLHLGRIQADFFPRVFGEHSDQAVDIGIATRLLESMAAEVAAATGRTVRTEELAWGFLRIAVERMTSAIKQISIRRGHDVTAFALSCFGGAAGQHACQVADALGISTILVHPLAGVLSAYGMGVADLRTLRQSAVEALLDEAAVGGLRATFDRLAIDARAELSAQGASEAAMDLRHRVLLKSRGTDACLRVEWTPDATVEALTRSFRRAHARHFGFDAADSKIVVESTELEAVAPVERPRPRSLRDESRDPEPAAFSRTWFGDAWIRTPVYLREELGAGSTILGPALIVEANSTTVVEPHWQARIDRFGNLTMTRTRPRAPRESVDKTSDPVMLEVFNNLFMHVAEQMGVVLENAAHSVNIKERLDFSCAVFDPGGDLIANAPHIPVHLGSMGDSVRAVLRAETLAPGDVFMLNSPYNGGTHLPDVTVVTPVFGRDARAPRFIVASRAHHADVGGTSPGSMPPLSRTIEDEGVMFGVVRIVDRGRFLEEETRRLFGRGPHPARNPDQNVADLKAQIAANARGIVELRELVSRFGLDVVQAYMAHVKDNAEECVRRAIDELRDGQWTVELDGGERIAVAVRIDRQRREAVIDFEGTSGPSPGNFNAPVSVARATVLYVFRTLVGEDVPLNAGCLKPLTIRFPKNSLLSPKHPAAVVAGNVETSQCIADALLAAVGACAAAQGTMNNFTFGDRTHQYYETICGGSGAGPDFDGATAVHTHMTNSRLTDPEVIEWRHPVRVRRFEIRRESGGSGLRRGGDGAVREIEFLEPMRAGILSNRRRVAPFGLDGGGDAAPGRNYVIRASGRVQTVPACAELEVARGDRFVIETPGGGGYGTAPPASADADGLPRSDTRREQLR